MACMRVTPFTNGRQCTARVVCRSTTAVCRPLSRASCVAPAPSLSNLNASQISGFHGQKLWTLSAIASTGARKLASAAAGVCRKVTSMSFLGVGAPEAILVGIVALVVFGPKGLAEAAKSLGATLRAFQPAIKEVVEVSQDLRGTLEKELGLDELKQVTKPLPRVPEPTPSQPAAAAAPATPAAAAAADVDPDIEAKRAASAAAAWGGASPAIDAATAPAAAAAAPAAAPAKDLSSLSMEELEQEMARRRSSSSSSSNGSS